MIQYDLQGNCYELGIRDDKEMGLLNDATARIKYLEEQNRDLLQELQRKDNIINKLKESINNFDVFKEFTFPLMKRDEEQQVISSIDYEWRKSIKEPFLNKIEELENEKE